MGEKQWTVQAAIQNRFAQAPAPLGDLRQMVDMALHRHADVERNIANERIHLRCRSLDHELQV